MIKNHGRHLIIDAYGIAVHRLKNRRLIKDLLNNLPKKFKMRLLGKTVVRKVQSAEYPDWGFSGFALLYESHISLHTWPEEGYVAMDIYSCKDFNDKKISSYLKKFWRAAKFRTRLVLRG